MKTALFGGTFNPVHIGHLILAEEVLRQIGCQRIIFIPTNIPPHKEIDDPGPEIRLSMLTESIRDYPFFEVSDCEILRPGISYSIESIRSLVGANSVEPKPGLIIGDDQAEGFMAWKDPDAIARESTIIIMHRKYRHEIEFLFPHLYIDNEIFPVSSTGIRERISAGQAWRALVPHEARKIIEANGLYGFDRNSGNTSR
ncbi:MAG: nicotinate (nicotinamide) nucleotide adenylyltransferase [Spirochaetaceae bacterium]|nr:nicotinate (nicotinamide) nucleotide adenylyltransferase [Spirochaetaceae bacterium]